MFIFFLASNAYTTTAVAHKNYDELKEGQLLIEQLLLGQLFKLKDGRVFQKGEMLRKRHKAIDVKTKQVYLFSGVYEVELV